MPVKQRKKQERVVTQFRPIDPKQWGKICTIPWTPATRILIAALFAGNGGNRSIVYADEACEGAWSRVMQANRLFIKHGLPYRIREYELFDAEERYEKSRYAISRLGLQLHTVTQTL